MTSDSYVPYVHASFHTYNDDTYCLLTNRRVDDGTDGLVDTQTVTLFMDGEGAYEIWDVYENTCDTVWDSAGVLMWDYSFDPGSSVIVAGGCPVCQRLSLRRDFRTSWCTRRGCPISSSPGTWCGRQENMAS